MDNGNIKGDLLPAYSDEELNQYVFDGFEDFYRDVTDVIGTKEFMGMKDYRITRLILWGPNEWRHHLQQIKDNPYYNMIWHIDEDKEGQSISQKVKRLCNDAIIDETLCFKSIFGTQYEEKTKRKIRQVVIEERIAEEAIKKDVEYYYYIYGFHEKRERELMRMYSSPYNVFDVFSYLVDINGVEWIDFILNDAKMDCIEVIRQGEKVDYDFLVYLDLCAEKIRLMNDKKIPRERKEYHSNEALERIFHFNKRKIQLFLRNIQGLRGAAIVHKVKTAIKEGMIFEEDSQMPLYKALKELGYPVTTPQNWSSAFSTKKSSPLIE